MHFKFPDDFARSYLYVKIHFHKSEQGSKPFTQMTILCVSKISNIFSSKFTVLHLIVCYNFHIIYIFFFISLGLWLHMLANSLTVFEMGFCTVYNNISVLLDLVLTDNTLKREIS